MGSAILSYLYSVSVRKGPNHHTSSLAILIPTLHTFKWAVRPWLSSYPSQAYGCVKDIPTRQVFSHFLPPSPSPDNCRGCHGNLSRPHYLLWLCRSERFFLSSFFFFLSLFKDMKIDNLNDFSQLSLKMIVLFCLTNKTVSVLNYFCVFLWSRQPREWIGQTKIKFMKYPTISSRMII